MSTIKKLGGKQYTNQRDNRKAALNFYRNMTRQPGIAGAIAAEIYKTLREIHRDPKLNSAEKELEFRNIVIRFSSTVEIIEDGDAAAAPDKAADTPAPADILAPSGDV